MAIAIKPLEDRIVIKINEAEEKTASGLVIPDTVLFQILQKRSLRKAPLLP